MRPAVSALLVTPVKGLRVRAVERVELEGAGARDNRRFYLIDERGRLVNGKRVGTLCAVAASFERETGRLALTFPDGSAVVGEVKLGACVAARFFSREASARVVLGPWSKALSEHAGEPLRLVEADPRRGGVDRGPAGGVSLVSRGSIERLAELAGSAIDARRFRMLVEVAGVPAHAEDEWVGRTVRIGQATIAFGGHAGRCLVTSLDPDTGVPDLPTLELLGYRRAAATTEPLAFGIHGEVLSGGTVRVGDSVAVVGAGDGPGGHARRAWRADGR